MQRSAFIPRSSKSSKDLAARHIRRYEDMCSDRQPIEEWWQTIGEHVLPRKAFITDASDYVDDVHYRRLYDTTAVDACNTLANGHSSYITPGDQRWFYWSAPNHLNSEAAEAWYRQCSHIAALELASSNFYTMTDEAYLDRSGFGICSLSAWGDGKGGVRLMNHPVQSYCISEGADGTIDTFYLMLKKTVGQLRELFGEDIEKSETLAKAWVEFQEGKGTTDKYEVLHCVFPRAQQEQMTGSREGRHLPIASIFICKKGKEVLQESGFEEMPYMCSRYLKHQGRGDQYGYSPAWRVMPTVAQLNFLQKAMDLVAEKQAVPPVLVPDYLEDEVDLRAGGQTMFRANRTKGAYALPQEWANQGRYDVGIHRVESKQAEVERAFHVDLFRMFASMDPAQKMTATEVAERAGEKMVQFSPSFTRFVSDFQPMMNRIFAILLRARKFPPPPMEAVEQNPYTGELSIGDPKVVYQSKIALALQQIENSGVDRLFLRAQQAAAMGRLDVLDNINMDAAMRITARNDGTPEELLNDEQTVMEIRERRHQQEQEERALAMAGEAAKLGQTAAA